MSYVSKRKKKGAKTVPKKLKKKTPKQQKTII